MLFFFELLLFVLVMVTLALGEFVSRGWALTLWLAVTATAIGGYFLARGTLQPLLTGQLKLPLPPSTHLDDEAAATEGHIGDLPTPLDEKWARTLLYNWRRSNMLLIVAALAAGGWYWLGR